jgi:hypothetical protein
VGGLTVSPDWQAEIRANVAAFLDDKLGPDIADDARRYAPVGPSFPGDPAHPRTPPHEGGELKASIEHHMEGDDLIVEAHAPYSAYVELGTAPHPIEAHGPWSLWSPERGYLGRRVNHPGSRPEPYLRPALFQERTY